MLLLKYFEVHGFYCSRGNRHLKQLQLEEKERVLQNEALGQYRDALLRIAEIDTVFESEENIAGAVADTLHLSIGTLRNLSDVMKHAANIWNFEDEFLYLAQLRKPMDTALEYSSDKRLAIWTSDPFKEDFVRDSAQWFAMHVVCRGVGEEVKRTQHELHGYIRENPTKGESCKVMKDLANGLLTDIEKEQKDNQAAIEDLRQKQEVGEDPRQKQEVGEDPRQEQEAGEDLRQKQEVGEDLRQKQEVGEDLRQKQEVGEDLRKLEKILGKNRKLEKITRSCRKFRTTKQQCRLPYPSVADVIGEPSV